MRLRYDRLVRRPTMPSPYGLFSLAKSFLTGTTILCPRCSWLLTLTTSCFRRTLGWTTEPSFAFRHPRSKGLNGWGGGRTFGSKTHFTCAYKRYCICLHHEMTPLQLIPIQSTSGELTLIQLFEGSLWWSLKHLIGIAGQLILQAVLQRGKLSKEDFKASS